MFLLNLVYVVGLTFPVKLNHFVLSSVGQVEGIMNSKLAHASAECFNELATVGFSADSVKL